MVSCSGFLPNQVPCNIHAATTMHFAAARAHSCSHYNAICIRTLQNTKEEPIPLGTTSAATAAHTRYPSSPPAATLHGKNTRFRAPASSQNQPHATVMQPLHCDLYCFALYMWCVVVGCIVMWCVVMRCIVMRCIVLRCIVLWCIVMWCFVVWCIVMWCIVMWCIVVWCIVMWYIVIMCCVV